MFKHCFYYGFAVGFVCGKCQQMVAQQKLTQAAVDGAASLRPSTALNGTDCGTCPRSLASTIDGRANRRSL
jgi:bacterioferritin-associated ferredoxin